MKFFKTCLQAIYILLGTASMVVAPFAFFFFLLELGAFRSIIYAWLVCAFLSALVILPTGTTKANRICKVYEEIFSEEYIED